MANYYFSGQGTVYVAERDESVSPAEPKNFVNLCNVPSLEISIDVTKFEHKEAKTGQRAIDLTIVQEKNGTFTTVLENINSFNLALSSWGRDAVVAAATIAGEAVKVWSKESGEDMTGSHMVLDHLNLDDSVTPTAVLDGTPGAWAASTAYAVGDYVNPSTPSPANQYAVCVTAGTSNSAEPSWGTGGGNRVTDGSCEWVTGANDTPVVGTDIIFEEQWGSFQVIDNAIAAGSTLTVGYDHLGYTLTETLTRTSQERWLRFEGLNTVDGLPVLLDIPKASFDPLQGFGLINEEIAQITLNGNMLIDTSQAEGRQFFTFRQVGNVDNR